MDPRSSVRGGANRLARDARRRNTLPRDRTRHRAAESRARVAMSRVDEVVHDDDDDDERASSDERRERRNPVAEFRALRRTFGDSLLKFIFSVQFGLKGALMQLVASAGLPYAQQYLKLSAIEMQRYGIVAMFPWTVKPLVGMVSDLFPIGGYHKRYYIAGASALGCVAVLYLAVSKMSPGMEAPYVLALLAINTQVATSDLLTEGKYTERMRAKPKRSSDMVSFVWICITLGSIFATVCSFFSIKEKAYRSLMWVAFPLSAQAVYTSLAGWLPEEKVGEEKGSGDAEKGGEVKKRAYGRALWDENYKVFIMSIFMACMCALIAVVQFSQPENKFVDLSITLGVTLILSVCIYVALPLAIANVTFFLFLTNVTSISFGGALSYWFTVDEKCNPGGPHFDYLFFSVYTSIIARVCTGIGVYLFQVFFSNANVRFTFWMSAMLSSIASLGDYAMVMRWNKRWGIPDKAFYLVGDTILEPMVGMMAAMPSVVLMSKMCPENMEATMFAILASFNNLGGSLSQALGVFAMDFLGIKTDLLAGEGGSCDFSALPNLIFYCGMLMPLLAIPLSLIFVPNINMKDVVDLDTGKAMQSESSDSERAPLIAKK